MKYPKINSLYHRDMKGDRRLLKDQWACPEFEYLKDCEWEWTEKFDGINVRVYVEISSYFKTLVRVEGRNENSQLPNLLKEEVLRIFSEDSLQSLGVKEYVFYGEGIGNKIQKAGKLYCPEKKQHDFVLFDIRVGEWWLKREDIQSIAEKLGIKTTPVVLRGTLAEAEALVERGLKSSWGDFEAEGLVGIPKLGILDRAGNRIQAKIKSKDQALKSEGYEEL